MYIQYREGPPHADDGCWWAGSIAGFACRACCFYMYSIDRMCIMSLLILVMTIVVFFLSNHLLGLRCDDMIKEGAGRPPMVLVSSSSWARSATGSCRLVKILFRHELADKT